MTARTRIVAVVAASAALAAAAVVGAAALWGDEAPAGGEPQPRAGAPPLGLQLGVRTDREARELRRAVDLYARGDRAAAGRIFERFDSLEARVGSAFADWPDDSLGRLERLGGLHASSGVVQLHLGLARLWADEGDAAAALRRAVEAAPDTPYALTAADLLHPEYARGLPVFTPSFPTPRAVQGASPRRQFELLRDAASTSFASDVGVRWKLLYGVALQRLGRPRSAERVYAEAARIAPNDPEALVAAAVGRFRKEDPARAFSRLGPLARRFPREATVRFHLGLLLLWTGRVEDARRQLELARRERRSPLAREAARFLERLEQVPKEGTG